MLALEPAPNRPTTIMRAIVAGLLLVSPSSSVGSHAHLLLLAADLVRKRVAVIVANTNATPYAISATKSIPIVFVTGRDPIAVGFVPNLNHPGGNVTGVSFFRF